MQVAYLRFPGRFEKSGFHGISSSQAPPLLFLHAFIVGRQRRVLARDIGLLFIHRSGSEELGNIPRREETRESGQDTLLFAVTPFSRFLGLPMVFSPFQSFSSINN